MRNGNHTSFGIRPVHRDREMVENGTIVGSLVLHDFVLREDNVFLPQLNDP
jgi:hypothetical protein